MPKALERALKRQAKKKGLSKERTGAYVYGTLRKTGWKPSREMKNATRGSAPFTAQELAQGFRRLG